MLRRLPFRPVRGAFAMDSLGPSLPPMSRPPVAKTPSLGMDDMMAVVNDVLDAQEQRQEFDELAGKADQYTQALKDISKVFASPQEERQFMMELDHVRERSRNGEVNDGDVAFLRNLTDKFRSALKDEHATEIRDVTKAGGIRSLWGGNKSMGELETVARDLRNQLTQSDNEPERVLIKAKLERIEDRMQEKLSDGEKLKKYLGKTGLAELQQHIDNPPDDISGLSREMKTALSRRMELPGPLFNKLAATKDPVITTNLREVAREWIGDELLHHMDRVRGEPSVVPREASRLLFGEGVEALAALAMKAPDIDKFLARDLPQRLDDIITAGMSDQDQLTYYTRSLFGDPSKVTDPDVLQICESARLSAADSDAEVANNVDTLEFVNALVRQEGMDPIAALKQVLTSRTELPSHIDLTFATDLGEMGNGRGVERTFHIMLEDGTQAIGKKSATPDMAANERMAHALGAMLELPVNEVQLGTFDVNGRMEPVSIHRYVGDNALKFDQVAHRLGVDPQETDYRDQAFITRALRHEVPYNEYHACGRGPCCHGRDNAEDYYNRISQRVSNPEIFDRTMLFDRLIDSQDRHGGNYMVTDSGKRTDTGQVVYKVSLIDNGRALTWGKPVDVQQRLDDFDQYLGSLSEPRNARHLENIRADLEKIATWSDAQLEHQVMAGAKELLSEEETAQSLAILKGKRDLVIAWLANNP